MELLEQISSGFLSILSPSVIFWIFLGVVIGIIFGAVPGLTATTGVAICTPLTLYLSLEVSLALLLGIYCGGYYAGSIPAILINTPGAPGNAATSLDGYPMSQKGQAGLAMNYSVISSWLGGTISAILLIIFAPILGNFALRFGPAEYFSLAMLGLVCVAGVSGKSLLKGIAGAIIGLLLGTVGMDPVIGSARFTFGHLNLLGGIALIPALIGLFAVTEVLNKTGTLFTDNKATIIDDLKYAMPTLKELWGYKWLILKSSLIGMFLGVLPGTGPTTTSWLCYNEAKRTSKNADDFGKGIPEGIIACESGNNAVTGGALVPLLTLGIPGDTVTAVLLGALLIQGLTPGPTLIADDYSLVAKILWILIFANFFMLITGLLCGRLFPKILKMPMPILLPLITVLCVTGGYAVNNSLFDVKILMFLGIIGYFLLKTGFPLAPIVLGLVLGPIIEFNFLGALVGAQMNPFVFVTRPLSATILITSVFLAYFMIKKSRSIEK